MTPEKIRAAYVQKLSVEIYGVFLPYLDEEMSVREQADVEHRLKKIIDREYIPAEERKEVVGK